MIFTLSCLALPLFVGFIIYLLPKFDRTLSLLVLLSSMAYALWLLLTDASFTLQLKDSFGVTLMVDSLSGYFILTNSLVNLGVLIYCWHEERKAFFYTQMVILFGSVNAAFVCNDLISFYVAVEVISIAAFLLIVYPRTDKSIWVGLRYLFVSNSAMLFYLVGAILVYKANLSFTYESLATSPPEAVTLILLGLLVKGGVFVSGLWLPITHSSAETPVSALLSGIVVKAGIFPLVRIALMLEDMALIIKVLALATAILGVIYAMFEEDVKRLLAFSTVAQLGFVLASPEVAGIYALSHGLVKSSLFLMTGGLPSKKFTVLKETGIDFHLWIGLVIASLSMSGAPFILGFPSKVLTLDNLSSWQFIPMNLVAIGTAICFAKFIFLPHENHNKFSPHNGFWGGIIFLLSSLVISNGFYLETYTVKNIVKSLIVIAIGWVIYLFIIEKVKIKLPQSLENLDNLIGVMCLTLFGLFWMLLPSI